MSATQDFIQRLQALKEGERSHLRRLAGQSLDRTLLGFDLFTGLWWPLRARSPVAPRRLAAPRRRPSWLVAKLYGSFPIPHRSNDDAAHLPAVLGRCERELRDERERKRFRKRFDALLESPLLSLEPHLRWALSAAARAVAAGRAEGVDWARLLAYLSLLDRADAACGAREGREKWAEDYLDNANQKHKEG